MAKVIKTSIARKVAMALSAMFLIMFLVVHLAANLMSVFSPDMYNSISHFMGTNPVVQFAFQPILMLGVIFHFVMGFVLELQNRRARGREPYAKYNGTANSTWMSRNMIYSGGFILIFLILHLKGFWAHEMNVKYIQGDMSGLIAGTTEFRYYHELVSAFTNPVVVIIYCVGIIFLCLHLLHGFQSSLQSVGLNGADVRKGIVVVGKIYSYAVCAGFMFVALYHYFNQLLS